MRLSELDLFSRLIRTRPLFTAAFFFTLGCALAHILELSLLLWLSLAAAIGYAALLARRNRAVLWALLLVLALPLGALRFELAWFRASPIMEEREATLSGRISEEPYFNEEKQRCVCVLTDVEIDGEALRGKLRLYLRGDEALLMEVQLAQCVTCTAKLWQGDDASNPYQFSFADYLRINGLRGYASAKMEEASFSEVKYALSDVNKLLCRRISTRIDRLFPQNAAVVKAFILGDRSEMALSDRENFNDTGVSHLLAISGMHISVLAMLISWLFGRFLSKKHAFILTLTLLAGYCWLIGLSPSLMRALITFILFEFSALVGRYSDALTRLACAALLHLLVSPMDILSASFILSYSASAGIVLLSKPLSRFLHCNALLHRRTKPNLPDFIKTAIPKAIMRSVVTSLAATLTTFPAVVHFFGAQPLWSVVTNIVAVPLAMLSYIMSILGLICGLQPLCLSADFLFGSLNALVELFAALPFASLRIARFPYWLSAICAACFLLASDISILPEKLRRFLPLVVLPAVLLSNTLAALQLNRDSLMFMDAGQADCALYKTEGKLYFFDVGDAYTPAADYIRAMNWDIDGVFLSHPHTDHAGGLAAILEICTPSKIYVSSNYALIEMDEGILDALKQAKQMGSEIVQVKTGDHIALSSKSFVKVLAPEAGISNNSANEDSLILELHCGDVSALFTGDMPASSMPEGLPDVDILKVAHHGGKNGVDPRTLTELSPSVAVISVGEGNLYGHPSPESVALLDAAGASVYRTDLCGAISIEFAADAEIRISTYKHDTGGL